MTTVPQADARLVSVVIITHNCLDYVGRAVQSALDQTWSPLEVIVVDDGSTDATMQLLSGFADPRIRYVRQQNAGPNAARNHGIRLARGEFIAFLDCDDWWVSEKLARQMARFDAAPDAGLVYSLAIRQNVVGEETGRFTSRVEGRILDSLLLGNVISGSASSVTIRRAVVDAVGMFDETLHFGEDWEYWIRVAARFEVACVPEFDVYLLTRAGSRGKNPAGSRDDSLRFMRTALARHAPGRWWFHRQVLGQVHYVTSHDFNAIGEVGEAQRELFRALLYNPLRSVYYKRMLWLLLFRRRPRPPAV